VIFDPKPSSVAKECANACLGSKCEELGRWNGARNPDRLRPSSLTFQNNNPITMWSEWDGMGGTMSPPRIAEESPTGVPLALVSRITDKYASDNYQ
jgi:hypothetical protein